MMQLKRVIARHGQYLDAIQMQFSDGIKTVSTSSFGGNGGTMNVWNVPEGEYVTQV